MRDWLDNNSVDSTRLFDVMTYTEKKEWKTISISEQLKIFLEDATVDKSFLENLAAITNWNKDKVYQSLVTSFQPATDSFRKGKFGEILHGEILTHFHDLNIPLKKYQYQFNPNTSLFGTDLIAFKMKDNKIEAYFFVETKLRINKDKLVLPQAYNDIIKTRDEKTPSYFKFILKELFRTDIKLHNLFLDYGLEISPADHFRIGMIFETSSWQDVYLDDLLTIYDRSTSNLTIDVIKIKELDELVEETYLKLGVNIV